MIPIFTLTISLIQWTIYAYYTNSFLIRLFICDPYRRYEPWRLITPVFIHSGKEHIYSTIFAQLTLGTMLESCYSWKKVAVVYLSGVAFGELAAAAFLPWEYGYGGSGGFCGLWAALAITTACNRKIVKYSYFRYMALVYVVAVPIIYAQTDAFHEVDYGATFGGLVAASIVLTPRRKRMMHLCKCLAWVYIFVTVSIGISNYLLYGVSKINKRIEAVVVDIYLDNLETWTELFDRLNSE